MHTVERLEEALALAAECGFTVRQEWFNGAPAGLCELKGRRYLFLDLALSPEEQLKQVLEALVSVAPAPAEQAKVEHRRAA